MTYEEFLDLPTSFVDDLCKLVEIKSKYHLEFTEEEKEISQYLLTYWEEMKTNELRYKFERCWEIEP
jgi:hypothetical protein